MHAGLRRRRWWTIFGSAILVTVIGAASASASLAASTTGHVVKDKKLTPCGLLRLYAGNWFAMDSYSHRKLAWDQASGQHPGTLVSLKKYSGSLDECWKILGGFGGSKIELEDPDGLCLGANKIDPRYAGVAMQMHACLSRRDEMFTEIGQHSLQLVWATHLCVGLDGPVQAGNVLYQERCDTSSPRQQWWVNSSP